MTKRTILARFTACTAVAWAAMGLSCGPTPTPATGPRARATGDAFSGAGALVERLGDREFHLHGGPRPPGRVGETLNLPFPPPARPKVGPGAVKTPPLQVLHHSPKRRIGKQNAVTVTFNQPMIPLGALSDLRTLPTPLLISPKVKGRFRWLGTKTLAFEAAGRLPFSTRYWATVPSGIVAESGKKLARKLRWSFETPRLRIVSMVPGGWHVVPSTPFAVLFNQRVDVRKVFAATRLIGGKRQVVLRRIPRREWKGLGTVGKVALRWEKGRVMVVKPSAPLAKGTGYTLTVRKGLVAGEGPLPTERAVYQSLSTYGPLRVTVLRCGYKGRVCRPRTRKWLRFSNGIQSQDPTRHVRLAPAVADLKVHCSGRYCTLKGTFRPQTRYRVTVRASITDVYDQKMDRAWHGGFFVGDALPTLQLPVQGVSAVTERAGNRKLPVSAINLRKATVRLVRVAPEMMPKVLALIRHQHYRRYRKRSMAPEVPGKTATRHVVLNPRANRWRRVGIPLSQALGRAKSGLLFVEIHAPDLLKASRWANPYRRILVQVTGLAVTARYDMDQIITLVTGLTSGKPVPGATVRLVDDRGQERWTGKSDAHGVVKAPGARALGRKGPLTIIATSGDDVAAARITNYGQAGYTSGYARLRAFPPRRTIRAFLHTDRNPYRPGDTVHIRGTLRVEALGPRGGIEALRSKHVRVRWWLRDARYKLVVKRKTVDVDGDGTFHIAYKIPADASLGSWRWQAQVIGSPLSSGRSLYAYFRVLAYRTPEYKVTVKTRPGPYFFGDTLKGTVRGAYYFGTALAGARASWTLRRSVGAFQPPDHPTFRFGELRDWTWRWRFHQGLRGGRYGTYYTSGSVSSKIVARGKSTLDAHGLLHLGAKLPFWKKGYGPGTVGAFTLEAQVFDKNRQAIAGRKVVTVHPASVYVGLRLKKALVKAGQDAQVEVVVTNLDGKRQAGHRVPIVAVEQIYKRTPYRKEGRWQFRYKLVEKIVGRCTAVTGQKVASCKIRMRRAGYFRLQATAKDAKGRKTRTVIGLYVVGKRYVPWKQNNQSRLELVPDQKKYAPGDTAHVLIKSPFRKAVGLLTVERNGIKSYRFIRVVGSVHTEAVRIDPTDLPNVRVSVVLVRGRVRVPGAAARSDLGRPRFATGQISLSVRVDAKRLRVSVSAAPGTARPGAVARVRIKVTDAAGKPVRSRVALMAVDEGVLSLLGFHVPDPVAIFHSYKGSLAALRALRADVIRQEKKLQSPNRQRTEHPRRGAYKRRRGLVDLELDGAGFGRGGGGRGKAMPRGGAVATGSVTRSAGLDDTAAAEGAPASGPARALMFKTRARFATTAYYNPDLATGPDGVAEVSLKLPDNLTTFRLTAVVLDRTQADRFGRGEGRVTVRRPLMLMPALPRFANFGDRFEAGVKVTNETGKKGAVTVRIQMTGAKPLGPVTRKVTLAPGQTEEVRFRVSVLHPGRARFRFLGYLGSETDAVEKAIPVNLPATTEAFATYGVTESSVAQPVLPPKDALTSFGGLEMSFSSTALTGMQDAVRYLVTYPWECTEQTASRVIPLFALRRILPAFRLLGKMNEEGTAHAVSVPKRFLKARKGLSRTQIEREYLEWLAKDGIRKLVAYQRPGGGYGYWGHASRSWPYPTAWAFFALLRAKEAGYAVPDRTLARAARWLSNFLNYRSWWRRYGWVYSRTMRVMAAWLLTEVRDAPFVSARVKKRMHLTKHLGRLYAARNKLPLFAKAWLMQAIFRLEGKRGKVRELLRLIDNAAIIDTPYKVHFTEVATESLRLLFHSESRTDAIVLAALMEVQPDYPLVTKVVRGLIEARVRGRWESTQANAYALLSLSRYYKHYEKVVPDYALRAWLGAGFIGQTRFRGRSMRVVESKVPMAFLKQQGRKPLILEKRGKGKLYYRLGLRYAPKSLRLAPEEQGFSVTRTYEPVQHKGDVTRVAPGRYRIKAGRYVRVRLRVVVPSRRYFVALDDPLPAGLEAVDTNLRTSARSALAGKARNRIFDFHSWYSFFAFSHKEKRDDRVVLFSDRLPSGVYEYTYLARATTYGTFVVPPLKAEEMYHPEVFGRNGTEIVEVVR